MRSLKAKLKQFLNNGFTFYPALVAVMVVCTYVNYSSDAHLVILKYYREFANLIKAGIYSSDYYLQAGTFPMWGYGFVLAVTQNKTAILVIQQLLNLGVILAIEKQLRTGLRSHRLFLIFRLILLFSFSLYFFHAVLWPYSFNSSFLILGILLLSNYFRQASVNPAPGPVIWSGLCIGISLNFRSDYLFCIYAIFLTSVIIYIIRKGKSGFKLSHMCLWFLTIIIVLLPWAFYTKKATGHYMLNSTNAGHVLYIGLGQLPNNTWQIQPYDDDSTMGHLIRSNLVQQKFSTTTYSADSLLKKAWRHNVTDRPGEYLKKCAFTFMSTFIQPFVEGDGFKASFNDKDLMMMRESMRKLEFVELFTLLGKNLSLSLLLSFFTAVFAIVLYLAFWFYVIKKFKSLPQLMRSNSFVLLGFVFIIYQLLLLSAGYYHRDYNTNLYIIYVALIFFMADHNAAKKDESHIVK